MNPFTLAEINTKDFLYEKFVVEEELQQMLKQLLIIN